MKKLIFSAMLVFAGISVCMATGHTVTATGTNVLCFGNCTGTAAATVSGGTGPFGFSWIGPSGFTATGANLSNLCAGTYVVTAIDSSDMSTATFNLDITQPAAPVIITMYPGSCGPCKGTAWAYVTGGTPPYTYLWSNGYTGQGITNLCDGTDSVIVTDSKGCQQTKSFVIVNNTTAMTNTIIHTDASCGCNGSINITTVGGAPPYTYMWSNGWTFNPSINLCAGTYSATVTDVNGCYISGVVATITAPSNTLSLSDSVTHINCANNNNYGSITVIPSGGYVPYSYLWTGGDTTATIDSLALGYYYVTVTDSAGCALTANYQIQNTYNFYASVTTNMPNCGNNGSATVQAQGLHPPFTFQWNDPLNQTTATAVNLAPGTYTVVVTDAIGCTISANAYISQYSCKNVITGRIYNDANQNCIQDFGETGLQGRILQVTPGYNYAYSDANGDYKIMTPNMNNTVSVAPTGNFGYSPTCPPSGTLPVNFTQLGDTINANNFGYYVDPNIKDLGIVQYSNGTRPGFPHFYWINYFNKSLTPQNATVRFYYDSLLQYTTATLGGIHNSTQHTLEWTLSNIPPSQGIVSSQILYAEFNLPSSVNIGTNLNSKFEILPVAGDVNPLDNTINLGEVVTGSYDPNDKSVSPIGKGINGGILQTDSLLLYTIHFQNTGNDTAFTVVLKDTLSPYLDPATIVPGGASHPYTFDLSGQGVLTFRFDKILLPDSNVNLQGSNGYVNYTVMQKPNNPIGTVITNNAYIYFDFNDAVVTNTVVNTISTFIGIDELNSPDALVKVYPNPFTDRATFVTDAVIAKSPYTFEMYNTLGEKVKSIKGITSKQFSISSAGLGKGIYFYNVRNAENAAYSGRVVIE